MKTRSLAFFFLITPLLTALSTPAAAPPAVGDGDGDEIQSPQTLPEALAQAVSFSALIRRNDNEQAKATLEIVHQLIADGFLREALDLANRVPGYRRGEALAVVARAAARENKDALFTEAMEAAAAATAFTQEWHQGHVNAHLAVAYAARGDWKEAEKRRVAAGAARQKVIADAGIAVERARAGLEFSLDLTGEEQAKGEETIQPELLVKAAALTEIGMLLVDGSKGTSEQIRKPKDAFRLAAEVAGITQVERTGTMLGIAKGFLAAGITEEGETTLQDAATRLNALGYSADWKPDLFLAFAEFFIASGRNGLAREVLEEAAEFPANIPPMERPAAYSKAAAIAHWIGEETRAKELWLKAVEEATINPNDRVQAIGCVEICLAYARAGRLMDEEVRKGLEEIRRLVQSRNT